MKTKTQKAKTIVLQNRYLTIASTDKNGKPWITPVFFAYDDDLNLYWVSGKNARHSENVRANPQVAIVIFDSTEGEGEGDAIYIEAETQELKSNKEIEKGMRYYDARASKAKFKVKKPENVKGESEWRFYKATPMVAYKSGKPKTVNGQYIDTRRK